MPRIQSGAYLKVRSRTMPLWSMDWCKFTEATVLTEQEADEFLKVAAVRDKRWFEFCRIVKLRVNYLNIDNRRG